MPERLDLAQPLLARFFADPHDHAVDGGAHWRHAGEMQYVALEQFERVRAIVPAVEPARHAHGHNDVGRFAFEDAPARFVVAALDRQQVGLQHALDETLQERRHIAAPERENKHQVLAGMQGRARRHQFGLERLLAPIALAQNGVEMHAREYKQLGLVPAAFGAVQIGLAESLAKAVEHRIADDDGDF